MYFRLSHFLYAISNASLIAAHILPDTVHGQVNREKDTPEIRRELGFDLSSSHGTVAVAYSNGSQIAIARIEGDAEYKKTMAEMSRGIRFPGPWYGHPNEQAIFTRMLRALRHEAEQFLGYTINAGLVSLPDVAGHRAMALESALKAEGLRSLDRSVQDGGHNFKQPPALFAAAGFGLCDNYHDIEACHDKLAKQPMRTTLTILFTSNSFCAQVSDLSSAYGYTGYNSNGDMDFSLGYDERHNNPDEIYYWNAVKERIMRTVLAVDLRTVSMVFVAGDATATADPTFLKTLDEAMEVILGKKVPVYRDDPETAAAKGAAEIARRGSYPYITDPGRTSSSTSSSNILVLQG